MIQLAPVNIVQFVFVFQASFGVLLIWQNVRYRGLCYLLLLAAASMLFNLFEELAGSRELYLITPIFLLGKGPLFYLFVYQLVYVDQKLTRNQLWHMLPMLLSVPLTTWSQTVIALGTISQIVYAVLTFRLIFRYHQGAFSMRSDAESLQLNWVTKVLVGFLLLGFFDLIRLNLQPYIPLIVNINGQLVENFISLCLFSLLIFKAVRQPKLFDALAKSEQLQNQISDLKNDNLPLEKKIYADLEQLIRAQSLHHKPRLSLFDLADEAGLNQRDISRAINLGGGISFCDYINKLRVEDVKLKLRANLTDSTKLLDIAFSVGFNSKSSFNAIFKRETGLTPRQYLKKYSQSDNQTIVSH